MLALGFANIMSSIVRQSVILVRVKGTKRWSLWERALVSACPRHYPRSSERERSIDVKYLGSGCGRVVS